MTVRTTTRTTRWRRLLLVAVAASVLLAACGGDNGGAMSGMDHGGGADMPVAPAAEPVCEPQGTALSLAAAGSKFDTACLSAPAGQAFTIAFDNKEPIVHNVVILRSHTSDEVLFRGELIRGPAAMNYVVPPLEAGTYVFHCDPHQGDMRGTLVVS